jgi:nucleolin
LGWGVTIEDLRACFEEYGTVTDTRIATDPQTGRSRGFGYVDFESPESAQKGLAASGQDLQGRAMNVDLATSKPKAGGANGRTEDAKTAPAECLFVGNLSFNSSEDSLAEIFGEYGTVAEVRLPTDRETGRKKGYVF